MQHEGGLSADHPSTLVACVDEAIEAQVAAVREWVRPGCRPVLAALLLSRELRHCRHLSIDGHANRPDGANIPDSVEIAPH
jgi:hypothetical protein